jgi:hypothetical protein
MPHLLRFQAVLASVALLAGAITISSPAFAGSSHGDVQVTTSVWDGTHPADGPVTATTNFPGLVLTALNTAFNGQKATICSKIKAGLTAANGMGQGFTAHPDTSGPNAFICSLGAAPTSLDVRMQGGAFVIAYTITGNLLELTTTQPTVLGSGADPRFSVNFDATLTVTIPIPSSTGPLAAQSVIGSISNAHVNSQNLSAGILKVLGSVINFFGGPNYQAMAQSALNSASVNLTSQANALLAPLNLSQLAGKGFTQITGTLTSTNGIALLLSKPINVPTHGNGNIAVTVEWQYGFGAPSGGCAALSASAIVQVGPPSQGSPTAPAGTAGNGGGSPGLSGSWQRCELVIKGVPIGLPLTVSAQLNGGWNTTKYKVRGISPYGSASNVVTVGSAPGSIVFLIDAFPTGPLKTVATPPPHP